MNPSIPDTGDEWPFRMLGPVPYRPDDFADWREWVLFHERHFFVLTQQGAVVPHHIGAVPIGDDLTPKS